MDEEKRQRIMRFILVVGEPLLGVALNAGIAYAAYYAVLFTCGMIFGDPAGAIQISTGGGIHVMNDISLVITKDFNGRILHGDMFVKSDRIATAVFAIVFGLLMRSEFKNMSVKPEDEGEEEECSESVTTKV